jgi:hypothetical protein
VAQLRLGDPSKPGNVDLPDVRRGDLNSERTVEGQLGCLARREKSGKFLSHDCYLADKF